MSEVRHLRILDNNELWEAAKARQAGTRQRLNRGIARVRRPKYLFSGLTACEMCGGGFILSSHDLLTCFNARSRGTCSNRRSIRRQEVEARVLRAMRERLFEPGAFAEFCAGFTEELNRLRREHRTQLASVPREIATIDRRSKEILELLLQGFRDESWKEELRKLDCRRTELKAARPRRMIRQTPRFTRVWRKSSGRRRRRWLPRSSTMGNAIQRGKPCVASSRRS